MLVRIWAGPALRSLLMVRGLWSREHGAFLALLAIVKNGIRKALFRYGIPRLDPVVSELSLVTRRWERLHLIRTAAICISRTTSLRANLFAVLILRQR